MERTVLHSDMNSFYASVEAMLDPSLRGKAVAVCGCVEDRHGIVLAKSPLAKKAGVQTGMANWEARRLCPNLITVPPQYDQYLKYSRLARDIYSRYTDLVEPYGMDECWLDVTASGHFGTGEQIADALRTAMREELGLTVSVGVSFNKVFAKLGSDMKKPDAVTVITKQNFREKVWPLPASDLLFVGRSSSRTLLRYGIRTVGDLARADGGLLWEKLGKNGAMLQRFARGEDDSPVMQKGFVSPVKSLGHGITCRTDLYTGEEVRLVMLELCQDIAHRLRLHGLLAGGVQIFLRGSDLMGRQLQAPLPLATRSPLQLAEAAYRLFEEKGQTVMPVRAVSVRAIRLVSPEVPLQPDLFTDMRFLEKRDRFETAVEEVRRRFGKDALRSASLLVDLKMPRDGRDEVIMPGLPA